MLVSAPYAPGDERGINELYELLTRRGRDARTFGWEWLEQPVGEPAIWVIKEQDTGEVVGQHCLMPLQLSWFGRPVMLGKTENTMMHPRFRGTGAYFPFEQRFIERELDDRFAMLMTTWAGGAPGRIRAKLGYTRLARWTEYLYFADSAAATALFGRAVDRALEERPLLRGLARGALRAAASVAVPVSRLPARSPSPDLTIERLAAVDPVAGEIDAFWERNAAHFGITIWRSAAYLRWRLDANPWVDHDVLLARREGRLVGYAVAHPDRKGGTAATSKLVDVVVERNEPDLLADVIGLATRALVARGHDVVRCGTLSPNAHLGRALSRAGYLRPDPPQLRLRPRPQLRRKPGAPVMLKVADSSLDLRTATDPRNWYFTVLFTEGIG